MNNRRSTAERAVSLGSRIARSSLATAGRLSLSVFLLAFSLLASCVSTGRGGSSAGEPPASRKGGSAVASGVTIAIFDFEVRSSAPGYEALSADVPAALAEALLAGGVVRPLERAALEKILGELELSMSGLVDPGTAAKVGRLAGAKYALLGTASVVGSQIRLSCRVVDVETSEIVYARSAYGDASGIFGIEMELAKLIEGDFSK